MVVVAAKFPEAEVVAGGELDAQSDPDDHRAGGRMNPQDLPRELTHEATAGELIAAVRAVAQGPLAAVVESIDREGHYPREVLQQLGALGAGSLSTREERAGPWWDWSAEKHALEWLFAAGEVTVAGRRGFERLYDLPERVIPAAILQQPLLTEEEAQCGLLLHAANALGVATEKDLRDYFRLNPGDARARLAQLVEAGQLQICEVQGWRQSAFCLPDPKIPRKVESSALLSPFDSLIWERSRTERLFDFRYRLEIYTPQDKRVYGYYVLPFLHNERIAARVDLRAERVHGRLAVHAVHEEAPGLDEEGMQALALSLWRMARWLGLERVQLNCRREGGVRLAVALAQIDGD